MRAAGWMMFAVACTGAGQKDDTGATPTGHTGASAEDWQPKSYVDAGVVCFEDRGADVAVWVDPQECLSSSCSRAFQGSCTATVTDTTITVTSDISWENNVAPGASCTADCGSTAVQCTLPALADGTYTVAFGEALLEVVVPFAADPCAM